MNKAERDVRGENAAPVTKVADVINKERQLLGLPPDDGGQVQSMALCLSGGGIRSATFSLGVLQGLAKRGLLGQFHYLSSVSGGGYIGTWLSAWIRRSSRSEVERKLAESASAGTSPVAGGNEAEPIKRLRAYSNFLSPVRGISPDSAALISIYVRNLLLHWAMVLPVLFSFLMIPRVFNALLESTPWGSNPPLVLYQVVGGLYFFALLFAACDVPLLRRPLPPVKNSSSAASQRSLVWPCFVLPLVAATVLVLTVHSSEHSTTKSLGFLWISLTQPALYGGLIGLMAGIGGMAFRLWQDRRRIAFDGEVSVDCCMFALNNAVAGAAGGALLWAALHAINSYAMSPQAKAAFGFPLLLSALGIAGILRAGLSRRWTSEEVREWWGRASGHLGLLAAGWLMLALTVIQLPHWLLGWAATQSNLTAGTAGTGSVLLAIGTAIAGYWSQNGAQIKEKARSIGQALGVQVMELAGGASILVLALLASLFLGFLVTRTPFATEREFSSKKTVITCELKTVIDPSAARDCTCATVSTDCKPGPAQAEKCTKTAHGDGASAVNSVSVAVGENAAGALNSVLPAGAADCNMVGTGTNDATTRAVSETKATGSTTDGDSKLVPLEERFAFRWLVRHQLSLQTPHGYALLLLTVGLCVVGFVASCFFGANAFSLNALYGNRLARAYLGASRAKCERRPHPFIGFDDRDNLPLHELGPVADGESPPRLFPVINTALNLVKASGDRLEWQQRKAASFFMTPSYSGCDVLGFVPTKSYGSKPDGLSAGRAMAISGAAASPSMGYHSSRFISMLMAFFNIRLGWWMPNPNRPHGLAEAEPQIGLGPVIAELLSLTDERRRFVYLSDGGHFENLGLYEMVRRRCHRILVVDAGCDPDYQYEDLENAVRKIRVDFGIEITFDRGLLRPDDARRTGMHSFRGTIHYSKSRDDMPDGEIICIKPVLSRDVPVDIRRYAESTRSDGRVFPQQPTSDQFFDEAQFESYRELGLYSALQTFATTPPGKGWPPMPEQPQPHNSAATVALPRWAPEATKTGLVAGLLGSVGSLGQAAMLATAISVTTAVTVTGAVALKNAELHLAPDSRTLQVASEKPLPVTLDPNTAVKLDLAGTIDGYLELRPEQAMGRLTELLKKSLSDITLQAIVVDSGGTGNDDPRLNAAIASVLAAAEKLTEVTETLNRSASPLGDSARDLKAAADTLKNQVNQTISGLNDSIKLLNGGVGTLRDDLSETSRQLIRTMLDAIEILKKIENEVQKISPRETVRGN